ncbi:penicillin-binding protein 1A [Saliniradius amylolyticus]|uniref:penicillin-binding protein 1A n=1 Tax=Saliniradius amylolyticus TaxID=2183582 RepID=UPI003B838AC3
MKYIKTLTVLLLTGTLLAVGIIAGLYQYIKPDLPSVEVLKEVRLQTPMKIYTQDGQLISQFGVKRRIPVTLEQMPQEMIQAILATEDSRFYDHPGIDIIGVFRAAVNLLVTGEKSQGASTITMQLARNFFLSREKAWMRKIKEMFIAWHIEQLLTKDEILELYLNKIELGHRAFGVGAAAQVYYGKNLNDLSLAQIATIAGLPKAPSALNPISNPAASKERRRVVLGRMLTTGFITDAQFQQAANAEVSAAKHGAEIQLDAPYLADWIYSQMLERYGKEDAETKGYRVYASVNAEHQRAAQKAVLRNLHDYDERHGYRGPVKQLWGQPVMAGDSSEKTSEQEATSGSSAQTASTSWTRQAITDYLQQQPGYGPLEPAVVVSTQERQITVMRASGDIHVISWDGLAWARSFISDTEQEPEPEVATDIVTQGAHIFIRFNDELEQWQLAQLPEVSGAFIALNPDTGAVEAVVGGYSFYHSQFNRATQAERQVGSNIKPFIYSAALEEGYTLASIVNDAPINQWDRSSGLAWRPKNSPEVYDGPIRLRKALGRSKNVVSVRLLRAVGLDNLIEHLAKFGFNPEELPRNESLALGSASLTPLEVASGFAIIANGGYAVEPYVIDRIEDEQGEIVWQANPKLSEAALSRWIELHQPNPEQSQDSMDAGATIVPESSEAMPELAPQVISEANAFLVKQMMQTAIYGGGSWNKGTYWQGTGWRANNILRRDDLAGKTGTTNDAKDTWFSGIAPGLVATSWVGFDDMSRSLGRTSRNQYLINKNPKKYNWLGNAMVGGEDGARVAQPAWIRFMQQALEDVPEAQSSVPDDIISVRIDRLTGKLTQRSDHTARFEYFIKGTAPDQYVERDEFVDPFQQTEQQQETDNGSIF